MTEKKSTIKISTRTTIRPETSGSSVAQLTEDDSRSTRAAISNGVTLTPEILHSFSDLFLKKNFDEAVATPSAHLEWWKLVCLPRQFVAIAAPRGHAKSTAISHTFVLANVCFRLKRHVLIVSDTEGQAVQFLGNIKRELRENDKLREAFGIKRFSKESETELVVEWEHGSATRVIARGAGQKIRGTNWLGIRPDLVVGDDLENDEAVLNDDRREKFRDWFYDTLVPLGSITCVYRVVGTILHEDSLLASFMPDTVEDSNCVIEPLRIYSTTPRAWLGVLYRAHPDFDDYTSLLWPEQWTEDRLRLRRQAYIDQGYPEGYAQEYLNNPIAASAAYFREEDLMRLDPEEEMGLVTKQPEHYYIGVDLAISEKARRAYTAMVIGGLADDGVLRIREVIRTRIDSLEISETLFALHEKYQKLSSQGTEPIFLIESENIQKSIGPFLDREMRERGVYLAYELMPPIHDKELRARTIQARIRTGMVEFDQESDWWPALKHEMLTFPRGTYSDQVDALAWLGHYLSKMTEAITADALSELEWEQEQEWSEWGYEQEDDFSRQPDPITGY